jgi:hypothetical protein
LLDPVNNPTHQNNLPVLLPTNKITTSSETIVIYYRTACVHRHLRLLLASPLPIACIVRHHILLPPGSLGYQFVTTNNPLQTVTTTNDNIDMLITPFIIFYYVRTLGHVGRATVIRADNKQ